MTTRRATSWPRSASSTPRTGRSRPSPTTPSPRTAAADENGNPIFRVRQGDPRRSTIFWVHQMQAAGPLGYGPPLFDPQTGETISGQAYIYGAALDTYAARSRDLAMLVVGQIKTAD